MKKHAGTVVLVVLALALGVWLWLDRDRISEGERKRRENSAFVVWRRDELTRISVAHEGESIVLERDRPAAGKPSNEGKEGQWRLTSPREERAAPPASCAWVGSKSPSRWEARRRAPRGRPTFASVTRRRSSSRRRWPTRCSRPPIRTAIAPWSRISRPSWRASRCVMPTAASRSHASTIIRCASRSRGSWRRVRGWRSSGRRSPRCAPRRSPRTPTPSG